ncbi:hypothetical protein Tco_1034380 [Tanacetum coccineum]
MTRVDSLEKDLKQTADIGNAIVKWSRSQDDPLVSLVQGLVTPSKTTVNASGEEQVEDISPNTLEAAKTLSRVASQKPKSIDKGRRGSCLAEAIRLSFGERRRAKPVSLGFSLAQRIAKKKIKMSTKTTKSSSFNLKLFITQMKIGILLGKDLN